MLRKLRLLLRENILLRRTLYPLAFWLANDVFCLKQRLIKKYGWEAVGKIDLAAKASGMSYCAFFGTLLGFIREKDFIRNDADMDFALFGRDFAGFFCKLEEYGFSFERFILLDSHLKEFSVRYKEISIDFFNNAECSEQGQTWGLFTEKIGQSWGYLNLPAPTRLRNEIIHGTSTSIPENFDLILSQNYGNYKNPVSDWNDNMAPGFRIIHRNHDFLLSRNRDEWGAFLANEA